MGQRHPGVGGQQVFEQKGHAMKRPLGQAGFDGRIGLLVHGLHHRVELRVERVAAADRLVEQVACAHRALAHQFGQAEGVV